jgi:hypothetical protein
MTNKFVSRKNSRYPGIPQRDAVGIFRGLEKTKPCERKPQDHHGHTFIDEHQQRIKIGKDSKVSPSQPEKLS